MAVYLGENEVGFNTTYGGIVPSGTSTITENGIYDVTNFASASVSVAGGSSNDFIVTLSQNAYSSLTIDKTFSEIISAFSASKKVVAYGDGSPYYMGAIYVDEEGFDYIDVYGYSFSGDNVSAVLREDYYTFGSDYSIFNNTNYYYEPHNMNATPSDVLSGKRFVNESGFQVGTAIGGGGFTVDEIAMRNISGDISGDATYVGSYAFASCSKLTTASFPNATTIGTYAFGFCYSLTTADFPSATYISNHAFYLCSALTTVSFPNVTSISSNAFYMCSALTIADFPNAKSIGNSVFTYCYSLTTASFPSATYIGSYAFSNCSSLTIVDFPSVTSIGGYAFRNCYKLTTISFPSAISIGTYAFATCSALTTASFSNVISINTNAFASCSALTTADFPKATSIGNYAFASCFALATASFPSATYIGNYAFFNCHPLTTASFPSATSIGSSVFGHCYNLLSLYLLGSSVPTLGTGVFVSTPIGGYTTSTGGVYGSIFVPSSLYDQYLVATNWSNFAARIVSV